jgi:membrane-associated phospholipid phosphatase
MKYETMKRYIKINSTQTLPTREGFKKHKKFKILSFSSSPSPYGKGLRVRFVLLFVFFIQIFSLNTCFSQYQLRNDIDFSIIGSAIVMGEAYNILNKNVIPHDTASISKLNSNQIFSIDKSLMADYHSDIAEISDYMLALNMTLPFVLMADKDVGGEPLKYGLIYLETVAITASVTGLVKNIATRTRPFVYGKNADLKMKMEKDARLSYFSGHSSWSFASAVFISSLYAKLNPNSEYQSYVWGSTLALAATTATLRVVAGKHYFTDVLTGAVVGGFIGWFIPYLHEIEIQETKNVTDIKSIKIFELKYDMY